jgi:threonylcarbamoyladenosine tRNA methylthiotransferase MtaB
MPRAAVVTIGCRLNQSEGDGLRNLLQSQGNQIVAKVDWELENTKGAAEDDFGKHPLDTCIINTCAVTERATRTSIKWIRRIAGFKPKPRLIVTGCMAQVSPERLKLIPGVDEVITQTAKVKLIEKCSILPSRNRAFLKIQDGCVNRCSYCLPAQIRGDPVSKPIPMIEQEIKDLVANGYQEIVLVGLNLGSYGFDLGQSLFELLEKLSKISSLFRIRLGCLEPDGFDDRILERFEEFHLCRHLHIPLQSGDDKLLGLMQRKYTLIEFRALIDKIVERIPDINLGTDLITGFPEEDELSFNQTLAFIRDLPIGYLHVFPYSPRPGTAAYKIKETVSPVQKKERVNILRTLSREKSLDYRRRFLNKFVEVITEPKPWLMTDNYIRIFCPSRNNGKDSGKLAKTLITEVTIDRTFGEMVER